MSENDESGTTNLALDCSLPNDERLAYSIEESANLLGVHYFSVYRLIQRRKLRVCRVLRGKILVPRAELLKLLNSGEEL